MDKPIERKNTWLQLKLVVPAILVILGSWYLLSATIEKSVSVARERLSISSVTSGKFEDSIPIQGIVEPLKSVYLDVVQGGTVEAIYASQGDYVKAGQNLAKFKNTAFQLDVYSQEAQASYQLDINANTRLSLDQNELSLNIALNEATFKAKELDRKFKTTQELYKNSFVSKDELESMRNEYEYSMNSLNLIQKAQKKEFEIKKVKILQLSESEKKLEDYLSLIRASLENLIVKAPISGQLTSFNLEIGQSKERGARLGRVDAEDGFKLVAKIDAFYLSRLQVDQKATYIKDGHESSLVVEKIYPEVKKGVFAVDLRFEGVAPENIKRGQSLSLTLILSPPKNSLLIENGGFYTETDGDWIFVLEEDGKAARKKKVSLGKRNSRFIEVIDGLGLGEQVVTSSYADFKDMERLNIE